MVLPSASITTADGSVAASHTVSSKEYPVGMIADADGHINGSLPAWAFIVPPQAAGASKLYFDIFNAQASTVLRLRKLFCIVATDVAVAPVLGVRLDVMRTSSAGTGGTAFAGPTSTSKTASAFWPFTPGNTLAAGITGRLGATGAAADSAWLFNAYVSGEETNVATGSGGVSAYLQQNYNMLPDLPYGQPIELPTNFGLKVIQGTVASAGNYGFFGVFTVE